MMDEVHFRERGAHIPRARITVHSTPHNESNEPPAPEESVATDDSDGGGGFLSDLGDFVSAVAQVPGMVLGWYRSAGDQLVQTATIAVSTGSSWDESAEIANNPEADAGLETNHPGIRAARTAETVGWIALGILTGVQGYTAARAAGATSSAALRWALWGDLPKVTRNGQTYAKIGDYLYTRHAIEHMYPKWYGRSPSGLEARGIPPSVVENTIQYGKWRPGDIVKGVQRWIWETKGGSQVITEGDIVITVRAL